MILVDFETTDLTNHSEDPSLQPGIVQVGLIEIDEMWNEVEAHTFLVNPEMAVSPGAFKTHGLSEEKLREEPTLAALLPRLAQIFRRHDTWVGFNNEFDRTVLWYQLLRYNWARRFPWPSRDLDIMKIARDIINVAGKQDIKHPNLTELHTKLFGEGFAAAHDAMADCRATLRCGQELSRRGYV
jgi:DNA polymerase-3 subunit alpha